MTPEQKRKEEETGRAFHHPKALDAVMVLSAALPGIVWVLFPGSNSSKIPLLLGIPVGPGPVSTWAPSSAQVGFDCKAKPVTLWKSSSCSWKTASLRGTGERCVLEGFREKEGEPLFFWGGGVTEKGCAHCLGKDHSWQHEISLRPVSADPGGTCLGTSADGCPKPERAASPSLKFSNLSKLSVSMACGMVFSNWITD